MQLLGQKTTGSATVRELVYDQRLDDAPQDQQIVTAFGLDMIQMQVNQIEQSPKGRLLLNMGQHEMTNLMQAGLGLELIRSGQHA